MLLGVRSSRKLSTETDLYAAALRALMRRAYSIYEMRQLLERRAEEKSAVRRVLERLKERKYLDDARYALEFARSRAQGRRQGRFRIARELRQRGHSKPPSARPMKPPSCAHA
jgi:regulatory protein